MSEEQLSLEKLPDRLWKPELMEPGIRLGDEEAKRVLKSQIVDPNDDEYGGFRNPEVMLVDALSVPGYGQLLTRLWKQPKSRYHQSGEVLRRIMLALDYFEQRAQYPDGSLDGVATGDMQSAPHAAFATLSLGELLALWEDVDLPEAEEIRQRITRSMLKASVCLREGRLFTHNHRWVACAAMAVINDLEPDPKLVDAINGYMLGDGVDQDADGFYSEYAAGYGMLTSKCLMKIADLLHRGHLLEYVRANLDLLIWMRHSNGEVACEFSYRDNDHGPLSAPDLFVEMADKDGRGDYLQMAEDIVAHALEGGAPKSGARIGPNALMMLAELRHPDVEPTPLPDSFRKVFVRNQIVRTRRGKFSATMMGRPWNPDCPFWGKPRNRNFLAVRYGDAIIDGTRIVFKYYGEKDVGIEEGGLRVEGDTAWFRHDFTSWVDGPVLWRMRELNPDFHVSVSTREIDGGIELKMKAWGTPKVIVQLEFAVRPEGEIILGGAKQPLVHGGKHFPAGGPVHIRNGDDVLEIAGDLAVEHRVVAGGSFIHRKQWASLYVLARTPYDGTITIRGRSAAD